MDTYLIWITVGVGIVFIAIKFLVVHLYRRLVAMDEAAPEQEED
jgi:hypothetical protein